MRPTSIENMTPPIGLPNAHATPAALAAMRISRIFTWALLVARKKLQDNIHTFAFVKVGEERRDKLPNAASYMHRWAFLTDRQSRRDSERLAKVRVADSRKYLDPPKYMSLQAAQASGGILDSQTQRLCTSFH